MSNDSDNVLVALTGSALVAPRGTTAPTSTSTSWGSAWVDLGYLDDNGIDESHDDQKKEITAWQRGDVVRRLITGSTALYKFTVIETTKAALELYYKGSAVTGTGTGPASISVKSPTVDKRAFGFDIIDGLTIIRMVIPDGEVVERGNITYKNDEAVAFELTVAAYPGSDHVHTIKYLSSLAGLPTS